MLGCQLLLHLPPYDEGTSQMTNRGVQLLMVC